MTANTVPRVAIYARCSTHHQDIELQLSELRKIAHQRGWVVVQEYKDEGLSGSLASRPGLDRMRADARLGQFDIIMVWKLDRIARSLQNLLNLLEEITHLNIGFVSLRDSGIDTSTPSGRLLLHLLGAFSEFERSLIRERISAGVERARSKGVVLGRPRRHIDIRNALILFREGYGLKATARIMGVPVSSLKDHLVKAGEWPRSRGTEIPQIDIPV